MKKYILSFFVLSLYVVSVCAEDRHEGKLIISPLAGIINNEIQFSLMHSSSKKTIKDDGPLYGLYMIYARPDFIIGALNHYSYLEKSDENGHLFFLRYYFYAHKSLQPTIGCTFEQINVRMVLDSADAAPFSSMIADINIWVTNPTIGISYKNKALRNKLAYRITPFIGYFNEQVAVDIVSPGMLIANQHMNGFSVKTHEKLEYFSAGIKIQAALFHAFAIDSKLYFRKRKNEKTLYTIRNRIDYYITKKLGLTVKYDYFQDTFDKNTFLFFGPSIVF